VANSLSGSKPAVSDTVKGVDRVGGSWNVSWDNSSHCKRARWRGNNKRPYTYDNLGTQDPIGIQGERPIYVVLPIFTMQLCWLNKTFDLLCRLFIVAGSSWWLVSGKTPNSQNFFGSETATWRPKMVNVIVPGFSAFITSCIFSRWRIQTILTRTGCKLSSVSPSVIVSCIT